MFHPINKDKAQAWPSRASLRRCGFQLFSVKPVVCTWSAEIKLPCHSSPDPHTSLQRKNHIR